MMDKIFPFSQVRWFYHISKLYDTTKIIKKIQFSMNIGKATHISSINATELNWKVIKTDQKYLVDIRDSNEEKMW